MVPYVLLVHCRDQVEGGECDVVTGVQVRDEEVSVLLVEGLKLGAIAKMWAQLPRHPSQGLYIRQCALLVCILHMSPPLLSAPSQILAC